MIQIVSRVRHKISAFAKRIREYKRRRVVVSIEADQPIRGRMLLSYFVETFLIPPGQAIPHSHAIYWEARQIAETFLELGYSVDVIGSDNRTFIPSKRYDFFIDIRWNMQRLSGYLNPDCIKIAHLDSAHILFHSTAEMSRLLDLQQRRGVTLSPRRLEMPNLGIEHADFATVLGNAFTISTYEYANVPIYRVPISTPELYPWPQSKNFDSCRHRFMWLGSTGMVHKGLDLVLEAFARMPECHLTICGPVQDDADFEHLYRLELYETSNIEVHGWIDIGSNDFVALANSCIGVVSVSCSEGGGGAALTCLHAGLIPIVSRENSVDVSSDYGTLLMDNSVETIVQAVRALAALPATRLEEMARGAWAFARENHTREKFAKVYRASIEDIIERNGK